MRAIPKQARSKINTDDFYSRCCYPGCNSNMVQMHHPLFYGSNNKQIADIFVPACHWHHSAVKTDKAVKEFFEWFALKRYPLDLLQEKYPKHNWAFHKKRLDEKYEK